MSKKFIRTMTTIWLFVSVLLTLSALASIRKYETRVFPDDGWILRRSIDIPWILVGLFFASFNLRSGDYLKVHAIFFISMVLAFCDYAWPRF